MRWRTIAIIGIGLAALGAQAQVHRCKDAATGKLVFSDRPCDVGQMGGQIQRKRTDDEIYEERVQAFEAEERKQLRREAEQERAVPQRQRQAFDAQPAPAERHIGNDWQARKDRENSRTSASSIMNNGGRWDANAQAERAAKHREELLKREPEPIPQPEEFVVKGCNAKGCVDTRGGTYTGGAFLRRNDGRQCSRAGNRIVCD